MNEAEPNNGLPTSHLQYPPPGKTATILLATGSYSPPTNAHLRLLIAARDSINETATRYVSGAYLSPVSNAYGKANLAEAHHRVAMCRLAVQDIPWAAVASWETAQTHFVRTHVVAERILREVLTFWNLDERVEIVLVCGADLRVSMSDPRKWPFDSAAALTRLVTFAVKRREGAIANLHDGSGAGDGTGAELAAQVEHLCEADLQIGPWVGDLSSTVVR